VTPIRVGLIGFGTVGAGVVEILTRQADRLTRRLGAPILLSRVADLDITTPRPVTLPSGLLTRYPEEIIDDPQIDIVVEVVGGTIDARELVTQAISRGKHVVTANKALLAEYGNEIFFAASQANVEVGFEASVCGGIPLILALRQGLAANNIQELLGIVNGTTNYILTRMSQEGTTFQEALREAQEQGYAEADPTLDIDGTDAAHKLAILMALAYSARLDFTSIAVEGISRLDPLDLQFAKEFGYAVKLLAISRDDGVRVEARVHPTMIPLDHMLAGVNGSFNAVHLTGDAVGPILLYGRGAGMLPTGSAVVADLLDIAYNMKQGIKRRVPPLGADNALQNSRTVKPLAEILTHYYFRFAAQDSPGVLSQIAGILGKHHISIAAVIQKGREIQGSVPIVMITHEAREAAAQQALAEIDRLPIISRPTIFLRIEDPNLDAAQI